MSNSYCRALGIEAPVLEKLINHPEANLFPGAAEAASTRSERNQALPCRVVPLRCLSALWLFPGAHPRL